jgi:predicted RNA methylase
MATVAMNDTELEEYLKKNPDLNKFRKKILVYKGVKGKEMWALMDETDKFSFQERMKCKKEGSRFSPSDYARKKNVPLQVARAKMGECTLHPVPMILAVLELFKPKKWLDPTSGWGDRLRGALLANIPMYVGVDSNPGMVKPYEKIVKAYPDSNTKVQMISSRIQDVKLPTKFDLVFTSPPFFTTEAYKGATDWKSLDHFYDEFLEPFLNVCVNHLLVNGHLVLYIENTNPDRMLKLVQQMFPSMKYEGLFYYAGGKPRPYYVWKKVASRKTRKNRS